MSHPTSQQWCAQKGDTFRRALALKNAAGIPLDLTTGYAFAGQIRTTPFDSALVATFALSIRAPATLGIVDVLLSASTTASMAHGTYAFDIVMSKSPGDQRTLFAGFLTIGPRVTR